MKRFVSATLTSFLMLCTLFVAAPAMADGNSLGLAVQILQGGNDSSKNVNQNNKLWFVVEPGASGSRDIMLTSTSAVPQLIELSIGQQKETDGKLAYDPEGTTVVNKWTHFSKNKFVLQPRAIVQFTMTINVPKDAGKEVLRPALLVHAKSAKKYTAQYSIPTAMLFVQGIFLGVGTDESFTTKFTIDDVYGQSTFQGRMLMIRFSNTGGTPVLLAGNLQLTNLTFAGKTLGPFKFTTPTISPGQSTTVAIEAPEEVTEDKFRIFIAAESGQIAITRQFEKDLSFPTDPELWSNIIKISITVVAAIAALIAWRILRRPAKAPREKPIAKRQVAREAVFTDRFDEPTAKPSSKKPKTRKQTDNIVLLFLIWVFKELRRRLL